MEVEIYFGQELKENSLASCCTRTVNKERCTQRRNEVRGAAHNITSGAANQVAYRGIPATVKREEPHVIKAMKEIHDITLLPPVPVLRLPRPPSPSGRGFDPSSPRALAMCPPVEHQRSRSTLRQLFLRSLLASAGLPVTFSLYQRVTVGAQRFNACDMEANNFQVSGLQTPLGVQKEAVIRGQDIISYSFHL
ncbi:gem-associated protein 7 [Pelodytes ibericus]